MPVFGRSDCDLDLAGAGAATFLATESTGTVLTPSQMSEIAGHGFPSVFADKTGTLAGEHHIRINEHTQPVQHVPRRLPVATRKKVQRKLDELEKDGIVEKVTEPTPWISSMVTVVKPTGKLQICLDPKDLNRAVQREKYQLPTIEDVATRLNGAKVFTKLDAKNGFLHIKMDKESSRLTTFRHTPLDDIAGGGCHSAFAQRLRFSSAGCTRLLKVLLELR